MPRGRKPLVGGNMQQSGNKVLRGPLTHASYPAPLSPRFKRVIHLSSPFPRAPLTRQLLCRPCHLARGPWLEALFLTAFGMRGCLCTWLESLCCSLSCCTLLFRAYSSWSSHSAASTSLYAGEYLLSSASTSSMMAVWLLTAGGSSGLAPTSARFFSTLAK